MGKKTLPRYKSNKYYAKFEIYWIEEGTTFLNEKERELIKMFVSNGELTPESEVSIENKYKTFGKEKNICWKRATREGKEKIVLGELEPNEDFIDFLNKFFRTWWGEYRKINYYTIKAICKLFQENPDKFKEMAQKAKNLNEFVGLMGIR